MYKCETYYELFGTLATALWHPVVHAEKPNSCTKQDAHMRRFFGSCQCTRRELAQRKYFSSPSTLEQAVLFLNKSVFRVLCVKASPFVCRPFSLFVQMLGFCWIEAKQKLFQVHFQVLKERNDDANYTICRAFMISIPSGCLPQKRFIIQRTLHQNCTFFSELFSQLVSLLISSAFFARSPSKITACSLCFLH